MRTARNIALFCGSVALCGLLWQSPLLADDDKAKSDNTTEKSAGMKEDKLPGYLTELNLSADQQQKIKDIRKKYMQDSRDVRHAYHAMHMHSVEMEAIMLAAIEDGLSEAQQKAVDEQRNRVGKEGVSSSDADKNANSNKYQSFSAETSKGKSGADKNNAKSANGNKVVEEDVLIVGVTMTPEQQERSDKIHESYAGMLHELHQGMQEMHWRMVALEANKITQIERVLTPDQLKQLQNNRTKLHQDSAAKAGDKNSNSSDNDKANNGKQNSDSDKKDSNKGDK